MSRSVKKNPILKDNTHGRKSSKRNAAHRIRNLSNEEAEVLMGKNGRFKYINQDMYEIYSNRSYNCDVTMLGCMNIMPMMYFQLNNIPMFRGAYMITRVEHNIRNNHVSTRFMGTRVSKYLMPYNKDVFNFNLFKDFFGVRMATAVPQNGTTVGGGNNGDEIMIAAKMTTEEQNKICRDVYNDILKATTLKDYHVAGILANIMAESNFNYKMVTIDCNQTRTKVGPGGGLCGFFYNGALVNLAKFVGGDSLQKIEDLKSKMMVFYKEYGCNSRSYYDKQGFVFPFTYKQQVDFVIDHIKKKGYEEKMASACHNAFESSNYWQKYFEKPSKIVDRWSKNGKTIEKMLGKIF